MPAPTLRDILPPSPEQVQQQLIGDNQLYRGFVTGVKGVTSGSLANDALNAEVAQAAEAKSLRDQALASQQAAAAYAPRVRSLRDINGVGDAVDYGLGAVGQGVASMAPTLAAAALTRVPGAGAGLSRATSYAGAAGAGYLQEKGETALGQYSDPTLAAAPVAERQRAATTKGVVNAALEGIVPAGLTSMVGKNGLGRIAAKDLVTEGATEAAQQYVGHLADKSLDSTRQLDPWDIADAFAGGALTGGVVGGVHGAAYKLATTPKDFVTSTRAAIEEAGANAPSPQDFLKSVFKPAPSVDLDPVAAGDNHPDLVEAVTKAGDAAGEVLDSFTAKRGEMAASYADEILNDPATPAAVKQTIMDMNGDYESPQNQAALGAQYVGRKAGEVASQAADFVKGIAGRIVKKNLQGGPVTEDETFALHKDIIDSLKPDAKRRTDIIADMPQLASGIAGVLNKYGATKAAPTDKNIQELQQLYSAASTLFDKPEAVFAKLASKVEGAREGAKKPTPFSDLLAGVTTAQQDVGKNEGASYLQTRLVAPMTPEQTKQLARFVDEFGMTDYTNTKKADKVLDGLAVAFGGKQEALQVLDYYSKANRVNAKQLLQYDENELLDPESGMQAKDLTPTRTYSFADAKTNRPFRRAERLATQDAASMRQGTVASDSAKVTTVPYSQYADETGKDHKAEVVRLMNDVKARQDKAYAGYAAELGVKGTPEAKLAAARKYAAERRPSPDAKSTRLADIDRLQGELDMAREAYKEGGPKAALDLYEVNAAEQNEKDDLTATDEDLKAMATNKNDEDMVAFTKADGTKMVLSSKSMLLTQAAKEKRSGQASRGEDGSVREKRLMKEAIASVLAREDIAGVASEYKVARVGPNKGKGVEAPSHPKTPVKTNSRTELKDAPPTLKTFPRSKDTKAALKEQEPSIAELKLRVDERVKEYEDNADQDSRDEIRKGIERNIARLQSQYEAAEGQAPRRAVIRQRQAVYKEALAAINDIDFQEKVDQREADGPDMATTRTEDTGARQYEEDTGTSLRSGEKRSTSPAAPDTPKTAAQLEREAERVKEQKKRDFEKLKEGRPIGEDRIVKNSFVGAKYFPESHKSAEKFFAGEPTQAEKDRVFEEHGWFKGKDGKLRREVAPGPIMSVFNKSLAGRDIFSGDDIKLSLSILLDAAGGRWFEAYGKAMKDFTVTVSAFDENGFDSGDLGFFDPKNKLINISPSNIALHLLYRAAPQRVLHLTNRFGEGNTDAIVEAAIERGYITEEAVRKAITSTFMHEFQHAIQNVEGFDGGSNSQAAVLNAYATENEKLQYKAALKQMNEAMAAGTPVGNTVFSTLENIRSAAMLRLVEKIGPDGDYEREAHQLYLNSYGETEAREVQRRMDTLDIQRRAVKPFTAEGPFFYIFTTDFLNDVAAQIVKNSKQDAREAGPANATPKDQQEALDEIERIRGKDVAVAFAKFAQIQGSGEFSMNKDKTKRLIRLAVDGANMKSTAWHEALHDFVAMLGTTPEERAIKRDMLDSTNTPYINAKLRELLKDHPEALKQLSDPEERLAYVYQFWAEGALKLTPKADSLLAKLATFIRQLMGIVSQDGKLDAQLQALHSGALTEPSTVARVLDNLDAKTVGDKLEALTGPLGDGLSRVFTSATDRLRKPGIEALDKIAVLFHKDPGHEDKTLSDKGGMLQRRAQKEGQLSNAFQKLVEGTTAAERKQALDNLQSMQTPSGPLELGLTKLLDEMYTYMTEAGVATYDKATSKWIPVRRVANYFPRAWDGATISKDVPAFKALLAANGVSVQQQGAIVDLLTKSGESQFDLAENDKSLGFVPLAVHVNDRMLTFINKNNAAAFAKYQNKDLTDIMTTYIRQASHRAEYARSFGNNGEVIETLLKEARSQGMTNAEEASILPTIRGLEGTLGHDMNPQMKKIMSGVITMENVLLMPMAIFSQMVDPIGIAMRTNSVKDAGAAYLQSLKDLKKFVSRDKSFDYDRELTKMLGIISTDSMLETMGQTQGSMYMTSTVRNINRQFFRYNGMEGWNNSMRVAATVAGERYLLANVGNERAMTELDLDPKYVLALPQGTKWGEAGRMAITKEQFESLGMSKDEAQLAAEKIQEAMFRFVDGAVVRPNAAHRATWMSDPRFQLLSHLKQFTFSFQSAVLNRARNEYIHGNTTPLLLLSMTVPIMLAADIAKWTMTGTIPANWTALDYMTHAVARSGILGKYEYTARAVEDAARGNVPGLSFAGPTVEHANILAQWIAGAPGVSSDRLIDRSVPLARYA